MTASLADLSDDELHARLRQAGSAEDVARRLVEHRDDDQIHKVITDLLEAGQ